MENVRIFVNDWLVNGSIKDNTESFRECMLICRKPSLEPVKVYVPHLQWKIVGHAVSARGFHAPTSNFAQELLEQWEFWTLLVHSNIHIEKEGVGLSLCYRVVDKVGGISSTSRIWLETGVILFVCKHHNKVHVPAKIAD